VGETFPG